MRDNGRDRVEVQLGHLAGRRERRSAVQIVLQHRGRCGAREQKRHEHRGCVFDHQVGERGLSARARLRKKADPCDQGVLARAGVDDDVLAVSGAREKRRRDELARAVEHGLERGLAHGELLARKDCGAEPRQDWPQARAARPKPEKLGETSTA